MSRRTKHFPLYVTSLVLTHGMVAHVIYLDQHHNMVDLIYLAVTLAFIVPLVFSFRVQSWQQHVASLLVTIAVWQASFVMRDWMAGRLSEPLWLAGKAGTWGSEILQRCIMPIVLVDAGALAGQLKKCFFPLAAKGFAA